MKHKKAEQLFDAITNIKDEYIQAAPSAPLQKPPVKWQRWVGLAACLCLAVTAAVLWQQGTPGIVASSQAAASSNGLAPAPSGQIAAAPSQPVSHQVASSDSQGNDVQIHWPCSGVGGATSVGPQTSDGLPLLTLPTQMDGGFGFEGMMFKDIAAEYPDSALSRAADTSQLPVYRNLARDESGAGTATCLSASEMANIAQTAADRLGVTLTSRTFDPSPTPAALSPNLSINYTFYPYSLKADFDGGYIRVDGRGCYSILWEEDFTPAGGCLALVQTLTGWQDLTENTWGDYTIYGEQLLRTFVYPKGAGPLETMLNSDLQYATLYPDEAGKIGVIHITDLTRSCELLANYPTITEAEAKSKLFAGAYLTTVPAEYLGRGFVEANIGCTELVWRTDANAEAFIPYYRFWLRLVDLNNEAKGNDLANYGAFYVPAIPDEYIATPESLPFN